jgi:protein CMS1
MWTAPRTLDQLREFIVKGALLYSPRLKTHITFPSYLTALPTLRIRLAQKPKFNGAPTLIFIAGAALRVADVTRVLKDKRLRGEKGGEVAKLFAKHFKLEEHVAYLKRTKVGAAVGTPGRIGKLLCETGEYTVASEFLSKITLFADALSLSALSHIILDVTFRDSKKRSLLDIPETRDEVIKTVLGCPRVLEAIRAGKVKVVLF